MTTAKFDFSFVTYSGLPDLDPQDRLVMEALFKLGFRGQAVLWDDKEVDWSQAGLCVVRSTWDYHLRRDEFVEWAYHVESVTTIRNEAALIEWNSHKSYLRHLADRGLSVVPTAWAQAGARADLRAIMSEAGWSRVIIKPAVGLATFGVAKVEATPDQVSAGQEHLDLLLRTGDVMIQPYYSSVTSYGERALVFIDGQYSHCVRKTAFQALAPAGLAGETAVDGTAQEIDTAYGIMRALDRKTLYARVDLVRDDQGSPRLLELELVEPSLFLAMHEPSSERMVSALSGMLEAAAVR